MPFRTGASPTPSQTSKSKLPSAKKRPRQTCQDPSCSNQVTILSTMVVDVYISYLMLYIYIHIQMHIICICNRQPSFFSNLSIYPSIHPSVIYTQIHSHSISILNISQYRALLLSNGYSSSCTWRGSEYAHTNMFPGKL